ncbi:OLC1v1006718C1 [Oldenlandia corymbosa var. corymbosa]|uniref:OLC1v1006718C1 n=1 Tax=Oldenlandia corymbosa var. corymbosa TaxID=529605 RepID=A0AAV1DHP1_OLDCO|nr:OLC1v1006718C1 [Oldenlandia corymbosa var. corymbosa]
MPTYQCINMIVDFYEFLGDVFPVIQIVHQIKRPPAQHLGVGVLQEDRFMIMGSFGRRNSPLIWLSSWLKSRALKKTTLLAVILAFLLLLIVLRLFVKNPDHFFIASEACHLAGIVVLIYKLTTKKTCSGLSLQSQELTLIYLGLSLYSSVFIHDHSHGLIYSLLDLATILSTLWVIYTMRFKLKSTYVAALDNTPHYYLVVPCAILALIVHPHLFSGFMSKILLAFSVYIEAVAVVPQLRLIKNAKMIEPFTAHYVFALGISRFLSCAHWIIQVYESAGKYMLMVGNGYLWVLMALLAEIVQTFILADFCYYYIKRVPTSQPKSQWKMERFCEHIQSTMLGLVWEKKIMLEVSRVGVAESDDEIELSLELSIGGRYGKCKKPRQQIIEESSSLRRENHEKAVIENVVIPRPVFPFPEASAIRVGGEFQVEAGIETATTGSGIPESTVDQTRKREIQALRRLEARRKREVRMRKSAGWFRGITINGNGNNNNNCFDKVGLEAQKFQERAQDRKIREDESLLLDDDTAHRKKDTLKVTNFAVKNDETAIQGQCVPLKDGFSYQAYGAPPGYGGGGVRNEENEMKEKQQNKMFQPVACGSFRPYVNGNGNNNSEIVRQNSEATGQDSSGQNQSGIITRIVNQNAASNGSLERSSSAVSDYRSTSGKGGSTSDTGSHSSCLQANDRQLSITATSNTQNQAEINAKLLAPKNSTTKLPRESDCGAGDNTAAIYKVKTEPEAVTSKPENPTSNHLKQSSNSSDNPSNHQQQQNCGHRMPPLPQMPCVSTTGNGPNGKTVTGFLYRYTKNEVSIVCVCHGSSFTPAEFVEHAGGTDVTNPLRHITMVASPFV